jgi:hypothetical protein
MKVLEPGHKYMLKNLGTPSYGILTFIKRSSKAVDYGPTEHIGTNTQEVLRALIDRSEYLNNVLPCDETRDAIYHLRMALFNYEVRAYRRKQEELNKEAGEHVSDIEPSADRMGYDDIPFTEHMIEERPVGDDGHILI